MRKGWILSVACLWVASGVPALVSQSVGTKTCRERACVLVWCAPAVAAARSRSRALRRRAGGSEPLRQICRALRPQLHPSQHLCGRGAGIPEPKDLSEVRIGFMGPSRMVPSQTFGLRMLHGAQLAVEEANARGGYGGKPFR